MPTPVTLEQLIAINDEIAALVKAGVPLELGLRKISSDLPRTLSHITTDLWRALNRGESLAQALESSGHRFPPEYRALVEAGVRSRNLPKTLESVTSFAQSALETRRRFGLALIYPFILLLLINFLLTMIMPRLGEVWLAMDWGMEIPFLTTAIQLFRGSVDYWAWLPPLFVLLFTMQWLWTGGLRIVSPLVPLFALAMTVGWSIVAHLNGGSPAYPVALGTALCALWIAGGLPFGRWLVLPVAALAAGGWWSMAVTTNPVFPEAVLVSLWFWWCGLAPGDSGPGVVLESIPFMGRVVRMSQQSRFTEMLAMLMEQKVPMIEALPLAAEVSGSARLQRAGKAAAVKLHRGMSLGETVRSTPAFPPMVRWIVGSAIPAGQMIVALKQAAETYRHRSRTAAEWMQSAVPTFLIVVFGGGITLLYGLSLFVPMRLVLDQLTRTPM